MKTIYTSTELYHHGIKGQRWGVRRSPEELGNRVPSKTKRMAKKDAKEFARAKMYYGDGAGTRRKLIKNTVNERSKDPVYKDQFEKYLSEQKMDKHASAAKRERKVNDVKENTKKTARGVYHTIMRDGAKATLAATVIGTGALFYMKNRQAVNSFCSKYGVAAINGIKNVVQRANVKMMLNRFGVK